MLSEKLEPMHIVLLVFPRSLEQVYNFEPRWILPNPNLQARKAQNGTKLNLAQKRNTLMPIYSYVQYVGQIAVYSSDL
jgi:hypothetical protein